MGFKARKKLDRKIVIVGWHDITTYTNWHSQDDERGLMRCTTIGVVLREDKEKIEVAHTLSSDKACTEVTVIPKSVIEYIKELREV